MAEVVKILMNLHNTKQHAEEVAQELRLLKQLILQHG